MNENRRVDAGNTHAPSLLTQPSTRLGVTVMNGNFNGGSHQPTTRPTRSGTYVAVGVKHCCDVLLNEQCDCAEFAAEARAALTGSKAIMCRPASQWNREPATALGVALHRAEHPDRLSGCILCEPAARTQAVA